MVLESTWPLTEVVTSNLPVGGGGGLKKRPTAKTDNLTAICVTIV
jgi:hypothetical protein